MLESMYPLWSFVISVLIAQGVKPLMAYPHKKKWNWKLIFSSGGYPSSHTAGVASLCMAVGLNYRFDSPLFAITLAFAAIVSYDAANVRYYAGKNIMITKHIIQELKNKSLIEVDENIYEEPMKEVLGHKWSEVLAGAFLGILIALILYLVRS